MRFSRKEDEEILRAYRLGIFFEDMGNHLENLGFINRSHDAYRIRIDQIIRNQAVRDQAVRAPGVRDPIIREKKSVSRKYTEAEIEAVRKLAAQGFSIKEIPLEMQKIGFEPRLEGIYYGMAVRNSFNIHSCKFTPEENAVIKTLIEQGMEMLELQTAMIRRGFPLRKEATYEAWINYIGEWDMDAGNCAKEDV